MTERNTKLFPGDCPLNRLPVKSNPNLWLWFALGPKTFRHFQKQFGGRYVWIAKHGALYPCRYCPYRSAHIRILRKKGIPARQLSKRFHISSKHAYSLIKGNCQPDLPFHRK